MTDLDYLQVYTLDHSLGYIGLGFLANYIILNVYSFVSNTLKEKREVSAIIRLFDRIKVDGDIRLLENKISRQHEKQIKLMDDLSMLKYRIQNIKDNKTDALFWEKDKLLAELYDKEETLEGQINEYKENREENIVELEELRERYDTLQELHELEDNVDFRARVEKEILKHKKTIRELNDLIKLKDSVIKQQKK